MLPVPRVVRVGGRSILGTIHTCTPTVFNREELQYGTYEMGVQDYRWGDEGDEILGGDEILE